jgi:hypothetical protein
MIWLLPHPRSRQQLVTCQSFCVSPVELTDGRGGRGRRRSQIIRWRESMVLYKSINTVWKRRNETQSRHSETCS